VIPQGRKPSSCAARDGLAEARPFPKPIFDAGKQVCASRHPQVIVEVHGNFWGTSVTSHRQEFLESVLRLEPRVAAFDCDGTLWSGDAGERFFDWEINQGIVQAEVADAMRARYVEYKAGKVSEDAICGEMVTMHKGMTETVMMKAASDFMENAFPGHIFPEMQELVGRLRESGCDVWAVSSSNEW